MDNQFVKQRLIQVQGYLESKDYQRARKALLTIQEHPLGQKWLARVDQLIEKERQRKAVTAQPIEKERQQKAAIRQSIPSQKRQEIAAYDTFMSTESAEIVEETKSKNKNKPLKPASPRTLTRICGGILSPITTLALSWNWRQLGKPEWATNFLISTLLMIALIVGSFVLFNVTEGQRIVPVFFYGTAASVGLLIGFTIALRRMQGDAYVLWQRTQDAHRLRQQSYNFGEFLLFIPLAIIIIAGAAHYFWGYMAWGGTYDHPAVSFSYPPNWQEAECADTSNHDCLFSVYRGGNRFVKVTLVTYPLDDWTTPAEIEADKRVTYLASNAEARIAEVSDYTQDGHAVTIRDSWEGTGRCANFVRQIYSIYNGQGYQWTIFATCKEILDRYWDDIVFITQSIDFKDR